MILKIIFERDLSWLCSGTGKQHKELIKPLTKCIEELSYDQHHIKKNKKEPLKSLQTTSIRRWTWYFMLSVSFKLRIIL